MAGVHKTVRVDPDLLEMLDELARERLIPETFTAQVNLALERWVDELNEQRARRAAQLVAADRDRAHATYRKLQGRRSS